MTSLFHRVVLALNDKKKQLNDKPLYLLTLHSDLDAVFAGGTEGHVRQLRSFLLHDNHAVLTLTPRRRKRGFVLRGMFGQEIFLEECFEEGSLPDLIFLLEHYVDRLHVHHTLKWPAIALEVLAKSAIPLKAVSAHDFWFLCPSVKLLTDYKPERFCEVESDLKKCNTCLATKWRRPHETIQDYRLHSHEFLQHFDTILLPSQSMVPYFQKAYAEKWPSLSSKIKMLSHDLRYLFNINPAQSNKAIKNSDKKRICFIGALDVAKGSTILIEAIPELQQLGFEIDIFGSIFPRKHPHLNDVTIKLYKTPQELSLLLSENGGPDFLGYVSIWAETFSYTFFEGMLLSDRAIPIVSPFGNPAQVCQETGVGVVMKACTSAALIEAVKQAIASSEHYHKKRSEFIQPLREKISHAPYLSEYIKATSVEITNEKQDKVKQLEMSDVFLTQASEKDAALLKAATSWRGKLSWKIRRLRRIGERLRRSGLLAMLRHLVGKFI